jgi:hypothetical protein
VEGAGEEAVSLKTIRERLDSLTDFKPGARPARGPIATPREIALLLAVAEAVDGLLSDKNPNEWYAALVEAHAKLEEAP